MFSEFTVSDLSDLAICLLSVLSDLRTRVHMKTTSLEATKTLKLGYFVSGRGNEDLSGGTRNNIIKSPMRIVALEVCQILSQLFFGCWFVWGSLDRRPEVHQSREGCLM